MISESETTQLPKKQDTVPPLNQLYFYLAEGCNLACRHCWLSPKLDISGARYPTLAVELFEQAIREAKPLGLSGVKLSGGEPLLHPHFVTLLEIIRREELSLNIETNGILCTPDIAAEIAKCPERAVSVSIDAVDAATHDWIRGAPEALAQAQQAVRNLVMHNTAPQIIMALMRCNARQVEAVVRMAEDLGASSVKFNIIQPTGRGENVHDRRNALDVEELITLGRYVEMDLARATTLKLIFSYPSAFQPLSRLAEKHGWSGCGILGILGVLASGHYALCGIGEHVPDLVFGKIGENQLEEMWRENSVLQALRKGLPEKMSGVCARCLMKKSCLGECIAQNYYRTSNLWSPFWFCERAEAAGLFPESRLIS